MYEQIQLSEPEESRFPRNSIRINHYLKQYKLLMKVAARDNYVHCDSKWKIVNARLNSHYAGRADKVEKDIVFVNEDYYGNFQPVGSENKV